MTSPSPALVALAQACGVMTEYVDWRGQRVEVTAETITAVLGAMDVDAADPEQARQERDEAPWLRMLPPTVVVTEGATTWVPVHVTDGDPAEVWVELEAGGVERGHRGAPGS